MVKKTKTIDKKRSAKNSKKTILTDFSLSESKKSWYSRFIDFNSKLFFKLTKVLFACLCLAFLLFAGKTAYYFVSLKLSPSSLLAELSSEDTVMAFEFLPERMLLDNKAKLKMREQEDEVLKLFLVSEEQRKSLLESEHYVVGLEKSDSSEDKLFVIKADEFKKNKTDAQKLKNTEQFNEAISNLPEEGNLNRIYIKNDLFLETARGMFPNKFGSTYPLIKPLTANIDQTIFVTTADKIWGYTTEKTQNGTGAKPFIPGKEHYKGELLATIPDEPEIVMAGEGLASRILGMINWEVYLKKSAEAYFKDVTRGLGLKNDSFANLFNALDQELVYATYKNDVFLIGINNISAENYREIESIGLALHNYFNPIKNTKKLLDGTSATVLVAGKSSSLPTQKIENQDVKFITTEGKSYYLVYNSKQQLFVTNTPLLAKEILSGMTDSFYKGDTYGKHIKPMLAQADEFTYISDGVLKKTDFNNHINAIIGSKSDGVVIYKTYFLDGLQTRTVTINR